MPSFEDLTRRLEDARLDVERAGDTLNVQNGTGRGAAKANIDPIPFLESFEDDSENPNRTLAGYASGVKHALLEPNESDAHEWSFTQAAGRLATALEVSSFSQGVKAAVGSAAWTQPLTDDLVFVFLIELDTGIRVLTEAQFNGWTETRDRVFEAARSMLFHKAQQTDPSPLEDDTPVERLRVGDGYDAARCLVLDDLLFGEFDDSSRFGMPTGDDLWFVRDGTEKEVEALRDAIQQRYDDAGYPLSERIFRFERSKPVPAE